MLPPLPVAVGLCALVASSVPPTVALPFLPALTAMLRPWSRPELTMAVEYMSPAPRTTRGAETVPWLVTLPALAAVVPVAAAAALSALPLAWTKMLPFLSPTYTSGPLTIIAMPCAEVREPVLATFAPRRAMRLSAAMTPSLRTSPVRSVKCTFPAEKSASLILPAPATRPPTLTTLPFWKNTP